MALFQNAYDRGYDDGFHSRKPVLSDWNEPRNNAYLEGWDDGNSDHPGGEELTLDPAREQADPLSY